MKKEIVCIVCPKGCRIQVTGSEAQVDSIEGNQCPRGRAYAESEFIDPCRILTSSVRLLGARRKMLPVRSSKAISKKQLMNCMEQIRQAEVKAPVELHQVIIADILGTGADMVACMPVAEKQED